MKPYQQRVVNEKADLSDKISKLIDFLDSDFGKAIDIKEQERLIEQLDHMLAYERVLYFRIAAFEC